ncbi:phospholipase A2 inhibitor and Ly6/PLAUR domain-containing protein-like [Leptodactylus fuscus]
MTSLIRILSLLSALTATSSALSCTECKSTNLSCSGSSVTCPLGSICGSRLSETFVDGSWITILARRCVPTKSCDFKGSLSLKKVQTLPTQSSNPNGVICPFCISADTVSCETSDTIQCMGDEQICILRTTRVTGPYSISASVRGCATKSYCDLGSESTIDERALTKVTFICPSGGLSVHNVILTPAMVCLLLMKYFF